MTNPRYVTRGVPRISQGFLKDQIVVLKEKSGALEDYILKENPELLELATVRKDKGLLTGVVRKILEKDRTSYLKAYMDKEYKTHAGLIHGAMVMAGEMGAGLTESGLILVSEDIKESYLIMYEAQRASERGSSFVVRDLLTHDENLLKCLDATKDDAFRASLEAVNREGLEEGLFHMGALGATMVYELLRRQESIYRLEDAFGG